MVKKHTLTVGTYTYYEQKKLIAQLELRHVMSRGN